MDPLYDDFTLHIQKSLNLRSQTLRLVAPLARLDASKNYGRVILKEADYGSLALVTLQTIINEMGVGYGATYEEILRSISETVARMCPDSSRTTVQKTSERVFNELINASHSYQKFTQQIFDFETGEYYQFSFSLINEIEIPSGDTRFIVTPEGITLYLKTLITSIEDEKRCRELMLEEHLRNGVWEEALYTAEHAKVLSIQYEYQIKDFEKKLKQQYYLVSWEKDIDPQVIKSRKHVEQCVETEYKILERLADLRKQEDNSKLRKIDEVVRDCLNRHTSLSTLIMNFHTVFIDAQDKHGFQPSPISALPNIGTELISALLETDTRMLDAVTCDKLLNAWGCVHTPKFTNLQSVFNLIYEPFDSAPRSSLDSPSPNILISYAAQFTAELLARVDTFIVTTLETMEQVALSTLLTLVSESENDIFHFAIIFRAIQAFDPMGSSLRYVSTKASDIVCTWFEGDDLCLHMK